MQFDTSSFIIFLTGMALIFALVIVLIKILSKRFIVVERIDKEHKISKQLYMAIFIYSMFSLLLVVTSLYFEKY